MFSTLYHIEYNYVKRYPIIEYVIVDQNNFEFTLDVNFHCYLLNFKIQFKVIKRS